MSKWTDHIPGATDAHIENTEDFHYETTTVGPDERVIKSQDLDALELHILHVADRARYYDDYPTTQAKFNDMILKIQRLANQIRKNSRIS